LLFPNATTPKEGEMYLFGLGDQAKWPRKYPEKPEPQEYYHHYPKLQDTASLEAIQDVAEKLLRIENISDLEEKVKLCAEYIKSPNRLLQFTAMEYAIHGSLWAPPLGVPLPATPHEVADKRNNILKKLADEVLSLSLVDSNEPSICAEAILFLRYAEPSKVMPLLIRKITDEDKNVRSNTQTVLNTLSKDMKINGDLVDYKFDDSIENLKSIQKQWNDWWQKNQHKSEAVEQEYKQDMARIHAVERTFKPGRVNNLEEYEKFADEIQKKWSQRNKKYNARLILEICGPLSSGTFPGDRRYDLAKKYALSILDKPEEISVEMELELTGHVVTIMYTPNSPKGENFAQRRRVDVEVRLHAWRRLLDSINPNWDPNEEILSPNAIAIKLGLSDSGMSPENVKDPKLRAEYEAALEKNRHDIERYTKQYRLHDWLKRFPKSAEEYIILAYSEPPFNLEELKQNLEKYKIDEKTKTRIIDYVQKNIEERINERPGLSKQTTN
jgi:hypothetical protein